MPRVTDRYVQRRRREILDAARRCFARDGFHAATMDDVVAEAGVSSSVVYRWFSGKDELITACITDTLGGMVDELDDVLRVDPPLPVAEAVRRVLASVMARTVHDGEDLTPVVVQGWAEAMRDAAVRDLIGGLYERIRAGLVELVRRHQAIGTIARDVDPEAAAGPLFSLFPGFLVQHIMLGPQDLEAHAAAADALLRRSPAAPAPHPGR